jgi:hypothetical protein
MIAWVRVLFGMPTPNSVPPSATKRMKDVLQKRFDTLDKLLACRKTVVTVQQLRSAPQIKRKAYKDMSWFSDKHFEQMAHELAKYGMTECYPDFGEDSTSMWNEAVAMIVVDSFQRAARKMLLLWAGIEPSSPALNYTFCIGVYGHIYQGLKAVWDREQKHPGALRQETARNTESHRKAKVCFLLQPMAFGR